MNCSEFRTRLTNAVESRRLDPEEGSRLARHARQCSRSECRRAWADEVLIAEILPDWLDAVPSVCLADRVTAELRRRVQAVSDGPLFVETRRSADRLAAASAKHRRGAVSARRWAILAATAACLLLLMALVGTGNRTARETGTQIVDSPAVAPTPSGSDRLDVEGPAAVSELIRTYASVPESAGEFVSATLVLFSPTEGPQTGTSERRASGGWSDRLSERLEPWGRDLGALFDAFVESVSTQPDSCLRESAARLSHRLAA